MNVVAIGRRSTSFELASKRSVRVPIHCHVPPMGGSSFTGTFDALTWATVPTATMGWLNVIAKYGAIGTSPSGWTRSTFRGPLSTIGVSAITVGGNC